jgi:hypothetical protein
LITAVAEWPAIYWLTNHRGFATFAESSKERFVAARADCKVSMRADRQRVSDYKAAIPLKPAVFGSPPISPSSVRVESELMPYTPEGAGAG